MDVKREASLLEQAGRASSIWRSASLRAAAAPGARGGHRRSGRQPVGYTDALGLGALRERIALHYRETYGVELDPQRVAVTTGSSGGFVMAFLALFDAGRAGRDPEPRLSGLSQYFSGPWASKPWTCRSMRPTASQ